VQHELGSRVEPEAQSQPGRGAGGDRHDALGGAYGLLVLHLRLISPTDCTGPARALLAEHPAVTNLVVLLGAGKQPEGDLVLADVAREAASDVFGRLRDLGLPERGSIAVDGVDLSLSAGAREAQERAPGEGVDAVVWEDLAARTREESSLSVGYLVFFSVATMLAGVAVLLDSAILIIGAMIVGPEFGAVAGICAGIVLSRWAEARRSLVALAVGFPVGIAATVLSTWLLTGLGLIDSGALFEPRPQTEFIYLPDAMSFVVAFLAGIAGMLALTSAKSGAVIGVLVSVTTIPAAGNIAVALAESFALDPAEPRSRYLEQAWTSTGQLLLNLLGLLAAGVLTLWLQRRLWHRVRHRTRHAPDPPAGD
jgi:uncharacterized hydrophobic protein (TIGR00271 family)